MKISSDGLVIWENKTGEADRVITILTRTGIISAYAKGSLRPKNKLTSSTAMLSWSNFELFTGKNMYTVDDAEVKNRFIKLSSDPVSYSLAVYFCELLKYLAPIEDDANDFVSLILNTLYILNESKKPLPAVKAVFELKVLSYAGYMPDVTSCCACGDSCKDGAYFDILEGTLLCSGCAAAKGTKLNCPPSVLEAMRYIISSELSRAFSFSLGKSMDTLSYLSEQYVLSRLEKQIQTLAFYKTVST